ncbi:MAG: porin, partial [Caballeronia sp.]
KWHEGTLQTDYSVSKRTDFYVEGVYQHASGAQGETVLSQATINTLSPSSTGSQLAVTVGMRHQF